MLVVVVLERQRKLPFSVTVMRKAKEQLRGDYVLRTITLSECCCCY